MFAAELSDYETIYPTPVYVVSLQSSGSVHASHSYTEMTVNIGPIVQSKDMSTATPMRYARVNCEYRPNQLGYDQGVVLAGHDRSIKGILKKKEVLE
jgi:hypothetical protein